MNKENLIKLYRDMQLIRRFEEEVDKCAKKGIIPGFIHLSIGQEAAQAGMCHVLKKTDFKYPDHRGHGAIVLCGTEPKLVMAEIFGKKTGINGGRGGSMHINDLKCGNLGFNGIQGSTQVTALGTAFASVYKNNDAVSVIFMGDGTLGEGACHESINMAATWKLPIIYCLINNQYAISTHYHEAHPQKELKTWGEGYEVPSFRIDGNDVEAVVAAAEIAVQRARDGMGPTLLELMSYRWQGHFSGDPAAYRPDEEVAYWKAKYPLKITKERLLNLHGVSENDLLVIEQEVELIIKDAVEFSISSPEPDEQDGLLYVYADMEVQ